MSVDVIGCILCGARGPAQPIVSEASRPWCPKSTYLQSTCDLCREFEQLENEINQLLEKRRQLKTRISLYHRKEIIQNIPPEVLSNIFHFFISSGSELDPSSPLILGAICGRWRAIAWATPSLWTSITIILNATSLGNKQQLAREWLSRSGQLPLSISITTSADWEDELPTIPVALLSGLIDAVNEYANRWRVLDIQLPSSMLPLFQADPHGISILHTLKIDPGTLLEVERVSEIFNPTNPRPSPAVVEIISVAFQSVRICWNNVTHLDVTFFSIDECCEVLRQAPSLTSCSFDSIMPDEDEFPLPESPLLHPNLTSLRVGTFHRDRFFQHVVFPSLRFLSVECHDVGLPTEDIISFLLRSPSPLHELHLLSFESEGSEFIIQILSAAPSLKIFHLNPLTEDDHDPSPLFRRLADPTSLGSNGAKFLPQLETLVYSGPLNFPLDLVSNIFGQSWRPLFNFRFNCYGLLEGVSRGEFADEAVFLRFQELVEKEGIVIEIKDTFHGVDFLDSYWWLPSPLDLHDD